MKIQSIYELDGILGYDSSTTDGIDIQASTEKYEQMLTAALQKRFPNAEIVVEQGNYSKLAIMDSEEEAWDESTIREIDAQIYEGFEWVVMK